MTNQAINSISSPNKDEIEEFRSLIIDAARKTENASALLQELNDRLSSDTDVEEGKILTKNGLGLLELKNLTMLQYISDLTLLLLMKSRGKKIEGAKAIERIVENRTVLEKMRPIEKKLSYQIDKYLKVAEDGGKIRPEDPIHFKPNPSAFAPEDDDDDESDEQRDTKEEKNSNQLYVAPKHIPTLCEDDMASKQDIDKEDRAAMKKRTLSKSIIEDLRRQHLDTPEEEYNQVDTMKAKHVAMIKERTRFEEDNFMRLPQMSKKEKHKLKKRSMTTMGNLADEITYFGPNNFYNSPQERGNKRRSGRNSGPKKKFKRN